MVDSTDLIEAIYFCAQRELLPDINSKTGAEKSCFEHGVYSMSTDHADDNDVQFVTGKELAALREEAKQGTLTWAHLPRDRNPVWNSP